MGFLRAAHGWVEDKDAALPKIYHNDETWHSYTLPKKDPKNPKNIWIMWHTPWVLLAPGFSHWKSENFSISRNTCIDCILIQNF